MTDITLFPMINLPDGSATVCGKGEGVPEFYDVLVQDDDGEVIDEQEDIPTHEEALAAVEHFLLKYPDASVDYGEGF